MRMSFRIRKDLLAAATMAAVFLLGAPADKAAAMMGAMPAPLGVAAADTGVVQKAALVCGRWGCRRTWRGGRFVRVWRGPRLVRVWRGPRVVSVWRGPVRAWRGPGVVAWRARPAWWGPRPLFAYAGSSPAWSGPAWSNGGWSTSPGWSNSGWGWSSPGWSVSAWSGSGWGRRPWGGGW